MLVNHMKLLELYLDNMDRLFFITESSLDYQNLITYLVEISRVFSNIVEYFESIYIFSPKKLPHFYILQMRFSRSSITFFI